MLKCSYVILLNNNEDNIPSLIGSIKKINGNFRREFIIIDDGSTDNSLEVVKLAVNDLPRTTIITQENQGFAISVNKAISLATGDYIHFVEGDELLHPSSTVLLIGACIVSGGEVACSKVQNIKYKRFDDTEQNLQTEERLIQLPINEILLNKTPELRNLGGSGSLASRNLLEKAGKADSDIYSHTMSLSLRCAQHTNFVFINKVLSYKKQETLSDSKFDSYNRMRAIYNFASSNPDACRNLTSELLEALSGEVSSKRLKTKYFLRSVQARYVKPLKLDDALALYKEEYEKLF